MHTLLLSSGELGRVVARTFSEADLLQERNGLGTCRCVSSEFQADYDVFESGEGGNELKVLKDEADVSVTSRRPFILGERFQLDVEEINCSRCGSIQSRIGHSPKRPVPICSLIWWKSRRDRILGPFLCAGSGECYLTRR